MGFLQVPDPAGVEAEQGHPAAALHDGYPPQEAAGGPLVGLRQPRLRRRGASFLLVPYAKLPYVIPPERTPENNTAVPSRG